MEKLQYTFRWFGPDFGVTLQDIRQTGATGVVTALHQIPTGEAWSRKDIQERKSDIESKGLKWSVVESVNVHESIKTATSERKQHIDNYIETLHHLAECDIKTLCYNFMPVLDWTRTHLNFSLENGGSTLKYDAIALAAFDLYLLKRKEAHNEYGKSTKEKAKIYLDGLSDDEVTELQNTVMAGLPGTRDVLSLEEFRDHLQAYSGIDKKMFRENLSFFLNAVIPVAEELGVKMAIHPDDPPFSILGLPRVVSTMSDLNFILNAAPSYYNGLTFCTGSLGANPDNNLIEIFKAFAGNIHFLHLRSVQLMEGGSFYEANHLEGSAGMPKIMAAILEEQIKRNNNGNVDVAIPMRPDHGHLMLNDIPLKNNFYPGYSTIGRMKALAELNGLETGLRYARLGIADHEE
jgi:mannonate dehydratase